MIASIAYKPYYYKLKYHGKFYSGTIAAVNDADAETELRTEVGQKFAFSTALLLHDSDGAEVLARGRVSELSNEPKHKPKPGNVYPKYSITEM